MSSDLALAVSRLVQCGRPQDAAPLCELLPSNALQHVEVLVASRQFDAALFAVRPLLDSGSVAALALAMRCALELGDLKQCASWCERILATHDAPQSVVVDANCAAATCARAVGDAAKAAAHLRKALELDPFCTAAMNGLIDGYLLPVAELRQVIDGLRLPPSAEALRLTFRARLRVDAVRDASGAVPAHVLLLQQAAAEHARGSVREAAQLTTALLKATPFDRAAVCLHLSALVDLRATPRLFEMAHTLVQNRARPALAVYAVGCYHYALAAFEKAGRYFSRATELDPGFAEAWVAYGHCYARLEEGELALTVYRRALAMFPGLTCCGTFVGMQYSRIHAWPLALGFLNEVRHAAPGDTLMLNEIGAVLLRIGETAKARQFLLQARQALPDPDNPPEHRDCILFNLGTAHRKLGDFESAVECYAAYVRCRPHSSHGHCALAFALHLQGNLRAAIAHYHTALSIKPDTFCRDMLDRALATEFGSGVGGPSWGGPAAGGTSTAATSEFRGLGGSSPAPSDISFTAATRVARSESVPAPLDFGGPSPHPSVGRILNF